MERIHLYVPKPLLAAMRKHAKATGYSLSDLLRRAIEEYLNGKH